MRESAVNWQDILAAGFASATDLLNFLELSHIESCNKSEQQFVTRVPLGFAKRMQAGNSNDPLLLQVLAKPEEQLVAREYSKDPLLERKKNPVSGLIHKYHGRVLLTVTGACAINCRFCFRRHFPYSENNPGRAGWQKAFSYIENNPEIHEVILSGGDPLLAPDSLLRYLISEISKIPHVTTLRIHTRIPVVLPERITADLLAILAGMRLHLVVVLHCNHPQELNDEVAKVCRALKSVGAHLLNQAVFLNGVNADVATLESLSNKLFAYNVLPYYLHLLDKTQGTQHFAISDEEALAIYKELQGRLSGYLLPKLVTEEPGKLSKTLVL